MDCDAFDFTIKLTKIRNKYKIYFLQVSAEYEYEKKPYGHFLSKRERIVHQDTFNDGKGFLEMYEMAASIDDCLSLESYLPKVDELIGEMINYPELMDLYDQLNQNIK